MFVQVDKASILNDTIKYLKKLKARVEEGFSANSLVISKGMYHINLLII